MNNELAAKLTPALEALREAERETRGEVASKQRQLEITKAELEAKQDELSAILDLISGHERLMAPKKPSASPAPGNQGAPTNKAPEQRSGVAERAAHVLRLVGQPMGVAAIAGKLANGHSDKESRLKLRKSVFSALNRRPDLFQNVGEGLYALAEAVSTNGNGQGVLIP